MFDSLLSPPAQGRPLGAATWRTDGAHEPCQEIARSERHGCRPLRVRVAYVGSCHAPPERRPTPRSGDAMQLRPTPAQIIIGMALALLFLAGARPTAAQGSAPPGDVYVTDAQAAGGSGAVIRINLL